MRIRSLVFWTQKRGNLEHEYEDSFSPKPKTQIEITSFRVAIADGATESSFSAEWANLLVRSYSKCKTIDSDDSIFDILPKLRSKWQRKVGSKPLPWYAAEKLRSGAFSSILGLTIKRENSGILWDAIAVGDSCLFLVRDGELKKSFPLTGASSFNSRPYLVSSIASEDEALRERLLKADGNLKENDVFYLMTDALAHWFLESFEDHHNPWDDIDKLCGSQSEFLDWISALRASGKLHNDDVTLVKIQVNF